ncbi:uncharacterized protein [Oryctolagus cuniculus]|uniref:uncharacterized protein n=1 Tax=Oryctolagus cuniculus TaxID=9986 RepID=UPI00223015D5|nr:uncharacterized protein LOC108177085 isoform X2 [Oryctolagus cuniculus]
MACRIAPRFSPLDIEASSVEQHWNSCWMNASCVTLETDAEELVKLVGLQTRTSPWLRGMSLEIINHEETLGGNCRKFSQGRDVLIPASALQTEVFRIEEEKLKQVLSIVPWNLQSSNAQHQGHILRKASLTNFILGNIGVCADNLHHGAYYTPKLRCTTAYSPWLQTCTEFCRQL